jgi:plasminogen activator inhibitor 1 RNA-binding protein
VIVTPAALPTVASPLTTLKVAVEAGVDMRAVDAVAPTTDTAVLLEGEAMSGFLREGFADNYRDSEKQANHGWGAIEGDAELKDEQAGDAIAKADQKDPEAAAAEPEAEPEPEDNSISYTDYLAQLAEKKLQLGAGVPEARKPIDKQDKKWANAKAISKDDEEDFVAGSGGKAKRERERKQKQVLDIDQRFVEAPERTGGRGGFRGGRGRGDGPSRGGRGEGGFRGGRGDGARGRGRGGDRPRGAPRGGASINTSDTSAFPSLGS